MRTSIVDGRIPYIIRLAEALTVSHASGFSFSFMTGRRLYGFIYVLQGSIKFDFVNPSETFLLDEGQCFYIPKGAQYINTYMKDDTQVINYQFDLHEESLEQLPANAVLMPRDTQRIFRGRGRLDNFQCAARIYELLGLLRQENSKVPNKYRRLQPALDEIERDPSANLEVAYYASLCKMSEPGFRRSFREYTGKRPVEYRNDLRLANARKLIMSGEYSIEEAARISGFTNLSFFYRLFRREYGVKPGSL